MAKMRPARPRRVQAQRKFAQGAFVPPNNATAVVANNERQENPSDSGNVVLNAVSAPSLLDLVSLQGVHQHMQPVVLIERLRGRNSNRNAQPNNHQRNNDTERHRLQQPVDIIDRTKLQQGRIMSLVRSRPKSRFKNAALGKRHHGMSLRSKQHSKLTELKKKSVLRIAREPNCVKRKSVEQPDKTIKPKKKCLEKDQLETSEFSVDDNRPLMYFAKCSTPNTDTKTTPQKPNVAHNKNVVQHNIGNGFKDQSNRIQSNRIQNNKGVSNNKIQNTKGSPNKQVQNNKDDSSTDQTNKDVPNYKLQNSKEARVNKMSNNRELSNNKVQTKKQVMSTKTKIKLKNKVQNIKEVPNNTEGLNNIIPDSKVQNNRDVQNKEVQTSTPPLLLEENPNNTQKIDLASPEPVAGPSGTQSVSSPCASRTSRYYSTHNIQRWMNDSDIPVHEVIPTPSIISLESQDKTESPPITDAIEDLMQPLIYPSSTPSEASSDSSTPPLQFRESPCPASKWMTLKDVIDAPQHELDSRCNVCKPCGRISKIITLSSFLKTQINMDISGEECCQPKESQAKVTNSENGSAAPLDADNDHVYMELLPKHPGIVIKIRTHNAHGKEMLSACLVHRNNVRANVTEFMLQEQEHLLDKLNEMLNLNDSGGTSAVNLQNGETGPRPHEPPPRPPSRYKRIIDDPEIYARAQKEAEEAQRAIDEAEAQRRREAEEAERAIAEAEAKAKLEAEQRKGEPDPLLAPYLQDDTQFPSPLENAKIVDAPVFKPTLEEFGDPIAFFERIWPVIHKFGICKVISPEGFDPKSTIPGDLRFDVVNQYISRLYNRWGPAAREFCAIKLCLLQQQNFNFVRPPLLDGVEVNLPKLNHLVRRHGGLETVINKKRWSKVAEEMKCRKAASTERKLDQIYVKYLLPYDSLSNKERQKLQRTVQIAWNLKNQKLLDRAMNPLHRQKRLIGESDSSSDDSEDEHVSSALAEAEDCITAGSVMNLTKFKKVAGTVYKNMLAIQEDGPKPSIPELEELYWRHVLLGTEHLRVHTASVDTGEAGHGFTKNKNDPYGRHPWNLKNISQNPRNMLRFLGPVLGLTVPTLHLGMLFSSSCWHKDPHALSWFDYTHEGNGKVWYGIPDSQAEYFRKAVETLSPTCCQNKGLWLPSDIAMIPPQLLRDHSVSLTRAVQNKNEFIVVFPNAYTSSFCTEYTESESVYFAPHAWLPTVPKVFQEARESCEPTMFSVDQFMLELCADPCASVESLKIVKPSVELMVSTELGNRCILQARGLKVHSRIKDIGPMYRMRTWNVRENDECYYCRMTLFLSMVMGLPDKDSTLCLDHAIKLLDSEKHKQVNDTDLVMTVFVSEEDMKDILNNVNKRVNDSIRLT